MRENREISYTEELEVIYVEERSTQIAFKLKSKFKYQIYRTGDKLGQHWRVVVEDVLFQVEDLFLLLEF